LVTSPLAGRNQVADGRLREGHQAARTQPLHRAKKDELQHRLRQAAKHRADQEDADRDVEEALAAVDVAQLAVKRRSGRRGDHEGGDDPREMHEPAEIADDARQRRADDVLVERGEGERQHQARENQVELALGNVGGSRGRSERIGCVRCQVIFGFERIARLLGNAVRLPVVRPPSSRREALHRDVRGTGLLPLEADR
jgi:hypothetical protein